MTVAGSPDMPDLPDAVEISETPAVPANPASPPSADATADIEPDPVPAEPAMAAVPTATSPMEPTAVGNEIAPTATVDGAFRADGTNRRSDELRPAIMSLLQQKLLETGQAADWGVTAVGVTQGRSILVEFIDGSRLLVQAASISPIEDIDTEAVALGAVEPPAPVVVDETDDPTVLRTAGETGIIE